ncbi:MAG: hypothetical protein EXS15_05385 [Phycisphaerales bacterium]|nr:hypothetical protein [Phycisphaerales bacterium]
MKAPTLIRIAIVGVLYFSATANTAPPRAIAPSLLRTIPSTGGIPFAVDPAILAPANPTGTSAQSYQRSAEDFVRTKIELRRGAAKSQTLQLFSQWRDAESWQSLWTALKGQKDDVRLAWMDHLANQGPLGEASLAWIAIRADELAMRHEASRRITRPACDEVVAMIELGLRDDRHLVVNYAGLLAGKVDAFAVIPSLIFAQVSADENKTKGDLAWIAIGTTTNYIANVVPVVGDRAGAFQPVLGTLQTGVLMRVQDAMVYTYRTDVHQSLVAMTTRDFGQSTADHGWDMKHWWVWFNTEYVPFKQAQAAAQDPPTPPTPPAQSTPPLGPPQPTRPERSAGTANPPANPTAKSSAR